MRAEADGEGACGEEVGEFGGGEVALGADEPAGAGGGRGEGGEGVAQGAGVGGERGDEDGGGAGHGGEGGLEGDGRGDLGQPDGAALAGGLFRDAGPAGGFGGAFVGVEADDGAVGDDGDDAADAEFDGFLDGPVHAAAFADAGEEGEAAGGGGVFVRGAFGGEGEAVLAGVGDGGEAGAALTVEEGDALAGPDAKDGLEVARLVAAERAGVGEQVAGRDEAAVHGGRGGRKGGVRN